MCIGILGIGLKICLRLVGRIWYGFGTGHVWSRYGYGQKHLWSIHRGSTEELREKVRAGAGRRLREMRGIALFKLEKGCLIPDIKCSTAIYKLPEVERMSEPLQKEQEKDGAEFVHQIRGNDISF